MPLEFGYDENSGTHPGEQADLYNTNEYMILFCPVKDTFQASPDSRDRWRCRERRQVEVGVGSSGCREICRLGCVGEVWGSGASGEKAGVSRGSRISIIRRG